MNTIKYDIFLSSPELYQVNMVFNHTAAKNWHIHKRYIQDNMLVFCIGGSGFYTVEGTDFQIQRGRMLFISHNIVHSSRQSEDDPAIVIAIRFSVGDDRFAPFYLCHDCSSFDGFYSILQLIIKYGRINEKDSDAIKNMNLLLQSLLAVLTAEMGLTGQAHYDAEMEQAALLIEQKIHQAAPVSVQEIIASARLSKYEFSRRFLRYFQTGFRDYVFARRISYSQKLLQETELSIKEIAYAVGYSDPYIFSNQFKKRCHTSPREYRKACSCRIPG